jgi:trehalose synthase-fused probable maltokinase
VIPVPLLTSSHGSGICATNSRWPAGLEKNAEAALPEFLLKQRWYPGKDAGRPKVTLERLLPFPTPHIRSALAVWIATPPDHSSLRLFVPLALVPLEEADPAGVINQVQLEDGTPAVLVEAFTTDEFVREWVRALFRSEAGSVLPGVSAFRTAHFSVARAGDVDPFAVHRSKTEQSNTSIRVGDDAILKVIRKLEEGIHPELEVSRFLSERAGFTATPKLLGWLELEEAAANGTSTLSILQAFVSNEGDGWSWVLKQLARVTEPRAETALQEAIAWLETLARRTAEMHRAFASEREDPAFRPEPVEEEDLRGWRDAVGATAVRAFRELAARREQLAPEARLLAERVMALRDTVLDRISELIGGEPRFVKSRHHGDFHLGQVLVADKDAVIIDFEGEPMRPLAERRMKHAALRDVAGIIRSLSYAVVTASSKLRDCPEGEARSAAEKRLSVWEKAASQAFFEAYLNASEGSSALPQDRTEVERLVQFFMLEKCL